MPGNHVGAPVVHRRHGVGTVGQRLPRCLDAEDRDAPPDNVSMPVEPMTTTADEDRGGDAASCC